MIGVSFFPLPVQEPEYSNPERAVDGWVPMIDSPQLLRNQSGTPVSIRQQQMDKPNRTVLQP